MRDLMLELCELFKFRRSSPWGEAGEAPLERRGDCILHVAGLDKYPRVFDPRPNHKQTRAHLKSYRYYSGEIPDGWQVHHLCGRTRCVNPAHLDAMPQHMNLMEQVVRNGGRPCRHPNPERRSNNGACRICYREYLREYRRNMPREQRDRYNAVRNQWRRNRYAELRGAGVSAKEAARKL